MPLLAVPTEGPPVLLGLLIMLVAAKLMAELFERLRQPAVAGVILAGVIIGPGVLGWVSPSELTNRLFIEQEPALLTGIG
ncbi:MAG TPA: cation:proton antiporter [Blastocatellia bacterium]|nr:cation:proton antiporter [Blastocatellia bacterium]